jgi:hypothetical protein
MDQNNPLQSLSIIPPIDRAPSRQSASRTMQQTRHPRIGRRLLSSRIPDWRKILMKLMGPKTPTLAVFEVLIILTAIVLLAGWTNASAQTFDLTNLPVG